MQFIDKIKNWNKDTSSQENTTQEIDEKFQHNRFKNIRVFAPDCEMEFNDENSFTAQILDGQNNPIVNQEAVIQIIHKKYKIVTDEEGYIRLPIGLQPKEYTFKVFYPVDEEYVPKALPKLTIYKEGEKPQDTGEITTKLYAPDMLIYSKDEPDYLVRLYDSEDNPISGEKIKIEVENQVYEKITDEKGFASLDLELEQGIYNVKTTYDGSEKYCGVSKESQLEVKTRDIDKEVMIELEHVAMEFKTSNDKIDTLKEYIIRTIKRNKTESKKIRILDDVSFKIYKGERVGILGFNGAGKSTLLRIIAGIYEPSEGNININGKIAPLLELSAGFDKNYTGKNNIFLNGALLSIDENFLKEKYDEIVEFSELGEHINYPIKNYSSGMGAKLGFSIATLINPEILIIDEILSVGDIKFRQKSYEKIKSLMQEGVTVLLVSHSISQIRNICDKCIWIENGRVYMEGDCEDVCEAYIKRAKK